MHHVLQIPGCVAPGCLVGTSHVPESYEPEIGRTLLPAELNEHAVNIARWFPDVLLSLGAPDLEQHFVPLEARVLDSLQGRTVEISLQRRVGPNALQLHLPHLGRSCSCISAPHPQVAPITLTESAATCQAVAATLSPVFGQTDVMRRLGELAEDFESLAMRAAAVVTDTHQDAICCHDSLQPCLPLDAPASSWVAVLSETKFRQRQQQAHEVNTRLGLVERDLVALTAVITERFGPAATSSIGPHLQAGANLAASVASSKTPPNHCEAIGIGAGSGEQSLCAAPLSEAPVSTEPAPSRAMSVVVSSPPLDLSVGTDRRKVEHECRPTGIVSYASSPALLERSSVSGCCVLSGKPVSENRENPMPCSARGGQAHQGTAMEGAGRLGRSRNQPAATSPKATAWRNERQSLQIHITKVHQLQQEPHSPKFVTRPRVWGRGSKNRVASMHLDRSAVAIRERMEKRLVQLFGESQKDHFPRKHKSID
mmetsp:Transcript_75842/g.190820  ORF Transcript_75842/g.190820 Transcript_75842/m.190820 type:complete len:483 (+) Transcript_75842:216-1664(+)